MTRGYKKFDRINRIDREKKKFIKINISTLKKRNV